MTLAIGWRDQKNGIHLAADKKVLSDDHGILYDSKIFKIRNLTVAFAGDVVAEHAMRHSYWGAPENTDIPADRACAYWYDTVRPILQHNCPDAEYQVIVTDGTELFVSMDGLLRREARDFVAIGEAASFAYGYAACLYKPHFVQYYGGLFAHASEHYVSVSNSCEHVSFPAPKVSKKKKTKPATVVDWEDDEDL